MLERWQTFTLASSNRIKARPPFVLFAGAVFDYWPIFVALGLGILMVMWCGMARHNTEPATHPFYAPQTPEPPPLMGWKREGLSMRLITDPEQKLLYVNLWGLIAESDHLRFRALITPYLKEGYILYRVTISSVGGAMNAAIDMGQQIRALRAQVRAPLRDAAGTPHCLFADARLDKPTARGDGVRDPDGFACLCTSACSYIWTAGFSREGDTVGVHMFRFTDNDLARWSPEQRQRATLQTKREADAYLTQMGMPAGVRARNWSTPPEDMYPLTRAEIATMTANAAFAPILAASCRDPNNPWPRWEPLIASNDPARSVCYRKTLVMLMQLGTAHYLWRLAS
jgi:hypothetical protein